MTPLWIQGLASDLGHALVHSLWQITLVAALLWSLLTLLHRASPRLRHVLAYAALVISFAWPLHTFQAHRDTQRQRVEARAVAPLPASTPITAPGFQTSRLPRALPWLGAAWILGVLLLGARQAGGWIWLARVKARTTAAPEALQTLGQALAHRMGLPVPELRVLAEAASPFCYGLLRSVVVLPAPCLADMDLVTLEALLAHEFAHLRRWDFAFNGLQTFIDLLLFHHPLARWISSQARLERERACDEAAAAACGDARTIARALLQLEDLRPPYGACPKTPMRRDGARWDAPEGRARRAMWFIVQGHGRHGAPTWRRPTGLGRRAAPRCVKLASRRITTLSSLSLRGTARRSQRDAWESWDRPPAAPAAQGAPLTQRLPHLLGRAKAPSTLATLAAALLLGSATLLASPRFQEPAPHVQAPAELVRLADAAAQAEGLDPYLVRAVIQVESRFNQAARSSMGSIGLMQVMPDTAAKMGVFHPETTPENLRAGTKFLRFLLNKYNGNTALAVMAYNAGPERMDSTEGIAPTEETRTYALAVMDLYRRKAVEPAGK